MRLRDKDIWKLRILGYRLGQGFDQTLLSDAMKTAIEKWLIADKTLDDADRQIEELARLDGYVDNLESN